MSQNNMKNNEDTDSVTNTNAVLSDRNIKPSQKYFAIN